MLTQIKENPGGSIILSPIDYTYRYTGLQICITT